MRAFIEHKLHTLDPVSKLYYLGPMFRHERPQKGRYRQFHQIGAEVLGLDDPKIDAQLLSMLSHFFTTVGIDGVSLQINSLGCPECRPDYRRALLAFLGDRLGQLWADYQRRAATNPLRALDCKVPGCVEATAGAPAMVEHLCAVPVFYIRGKSKTGIWKSAFLDFHALPFASGKDVYDIRAKRLYGEKSSQIGVENNILLSSIVETVLGNFIYPNTALLGLRIKATGQLSGSPPNVVTLVKGAKVQVPDIENASPSGANVVFDQVFWNSTNSRWENISGTELYWNNTSTWRTEHSNNSMMCVRDLVLNKRYGIGEYIYSKDLSSAGVITNIKECQKGYNVSATNLTIWWTGAPKDKFIDSVIPAWWLGTTYFNLNWETRRLSLKNGAVYHIEFKLTEPFVKGQNYTVSVQINNLTKDNGAPALGKLIGYLTGPHPPGRPSLC